MTSQSPRIYVYKITFQEVPYYYYGVHKEKKFDEEYWGSPKTHKWCWELYTPKKQILQLFDFTDECWIEANEIEQRLIRPFYQTDKWCLNESCGGVISLDILKENGKKLVDLKLGIHNLTPEERAENSRKTGKKIYENKLGIHGRSPEQMSEDGKKGASLLTKEQRSDAGKIGGTKTYEIKVGIHGLTPEKMSENGKKGYESGLGKLDEKERSNNSRKGGKKTTELKVGVHGISPEEKSKIGKRNYQMKVGIHALTPEETLENAKKGGNKAKELGLGVHGIPKEQMVENSRKGGLVGGKTTSAQKWMCLETGFITNAGNLTKYQNKRCIDTSKRKRIA
jgi:hypothetical protein